MKPGERIPSTTAEQYAGATINRHALKNFPPKFGGCTPNGSSSQRVLVVFSHGDLLSRDLDLWIILKIRF